MGGSLEGSTSAQDGYQPGMAINVTSDSTPGSGNDVKVFIDSTTCSGTPISADMPATIGLTVVPVDPDITTVGPDGDIKGGDGDDLSAEVDGNVQATVTANGYVGAT